MQPAPVDLLGPGQSDFPFAKPLFQRALQQSSEWSVFDFRRMREYADRNHDMDPRLVKMIYGFDFAVVIPAGTASSELK